MDGLALICNLFADGPVTLGRLRAARVASLDELERAAPERLASWLHASVPQARTFIEEARKLVRRLAEEAPPVPARAPRDLVRTGASLTARRETVSSTSQGTNALPLRPGLIPGLDETVCARLALNHVRSLQALSESAGLALARRTGIPYSALLDLARHARGHLAGHKRSRGVRSAALAEIELVPFVREPRRAPAESELAPSDEFTLPLIEPEAAGPFG